VRQGIVTGASTRNWNSYGEAVKLDAQITDWQRNLLTDPQTSGGLLVACAPESESAVLEIFRRDGFQPAVIGELAGTIPEQGSIAVI